MDKKLKPGKSITRNIGVYLLILLVAAAVFVGIGQINKPQGQEKDITTVLSEIKAGQVDHLTITGTNVDVTMKDGSLQHTTKESSDSMIQLMQSAGIKPDAVPITVKDDSSGGSVWLSLLFGSV